MAMKALTICQPYASLIASGEKRVENRTWPTSYRGPLAIHAGKSRAWLCGTPPEDMPFGAIVAVADLTHCLTVDRYGRILKLPTDLAWIQSHDHTEGPWCWVLANVRRIEPIPYRGAQGLFDLPEHVALAVLTRGAAHAR